MKNMVKLNKNHYSKLTNIVPHYLSRDTVYIFKMNYKKQNLLSTSKISIFIVNPNLEKEQIPKKKLGKKKKRNFIMIFGIHHEFMSHD